MIVGIVGVLIAAQQPTSRRPARLDAYGSHSNWLHRQPWPREERQRLQRPHRLSQAGRLGAGSRREAGPPSCGFLSICASIAKRIASARLTWPSRRPHDVHRTFATSARAIAPETQDFVVRSRHFVN